MNHAHVVYDGQPLVLLRFNDGDGALAFPHQVRKNGYIKLECQLEPGYAHIDHDGQIWRNQGIIAYVDDDEELARVWDSLNPF